ncbi:hypothetical protein RBB76_21770 [Tunturiibacter psychrotolerans]
MFRRERFLDGTPLVVADGEVGPVLDVKAHQIVAVRGEDRGLIVVVAGVDIGSGGEQERRN